MAHKLLKNEYGLIYLFSRLKINEPELQEIKNILSKTLDWEKLRNISLKQQVYQFLYYNLKESGTSGLIPSKILDETKSAYYANLIRNLSLEKEILLISEKAKTKNLQIIPFRGTSAIYGVYNNPALRQMADVDILVKPEDFQSVKNILLETGYQEHDSEGHSMDDGSITSFFKKISGNLTAFIEPHTAIASPRPYDIELPHLWERSVQITIENKKILILSKEDLILSIALHLRRHARRLVLKSIVDTAEILNADKNTLDWDYIIKNACNNRMISSLYLSLYLAKELLGADAPRDAINRIKPGLVKDFLIKITVNKNSFFSLKAWNGAILRLLMFDTPKDFIYYLWRIVFLKIVLKKAGAGNRIKNRTEAIKK